ncbi:MAG: hypothetical protein B0D94_03350, partial [Candidatus Sedimenticola endophacoides]
MWFVIAAEDRPGLERTIARIEETCGLPVYDFPKRREFYLGLWFEIDEQGALATRSIAAPPNGPAHRLDDIDRRLVVDTQEGLALEPHPYAAVARRSGITEGEVIGRLRRMLDSGVIRRIGLVPNHYQLGFRGNGMSVWDIPDERVAELGPLVAGLDFVSHCYERPRHHGVWPYNLFAMVHGRDRDQECRYLVKDFGTSQSPKSTRQRDSRYCPDRPALITTPSRT